MEFKKWKVQLEITAETPSIDERGIKTLLADILKHVSKDGVSMSDVSNMNVTPMGDNGRCYVRGFNGWYMPSCVHGYRDCVYDPAYIKNSDPEWWEELGCPTSCEDCEDGDRYDDEDK